MRAEMLARVMAYENAPREGYWNNERNSFPQYPIPVHSDEEIPNKAQILSQLTKAEEAAQKFRFMGHSDCRCCGIQNGNAEFYNEKHVIRWPNGLRHYIEVHNVMPSEAFLAMLNDVE